MKILIFFAPLFLLSACGNDLAITDVPVTLSGKVFEVSTQKELSLSDLLAQTKDTRFFILGEKHYTDPVQKAESELIRAIAEFRNRKSRFVVGWEFLNYTDQKAIADDFAQVKTGKQTVEQFLDKTQGTGKGRPYAPVLSAISRLDGRLIGTNLPRSKKSEIVKKGVKDADPALFPPTFQLGGADYLQRFKDALGDTHGLNLDNLFAAQSVTDSWMAESLYGNQDSNLNFLINGSFHSDYHDGVVVQLKRKEAGLKPIVLRLVEAADAEAKPASWIDAKYGQLSDFVVVVGKP